MGAQITDPATIERVARDLAGKIRRTPVLDLSTTAFATAVGAKSLHAKLELLQHTGSFKVRGALNHMAGLDRQQREQGVCAVSAGNHAIATAYAARQYAVSAKVVLLATTHAVRRNACRELGAQVVTAPSVHEAFETVNRVQSEEQRYFVHPYDAPQTIQGTATLGMELVEDLADMDLLIVPIGGGGLAAGVAAAVKSSLPACRIVGVEPEGANSMQRSLQAGVAVAQERVATIADSLAAPAAGELAFAHCSRFLDEVVTVTDAELINALRRMHDTLGLAVEPACAAALAAMAGPLADRCLGQRVAVIFCGSNIAPADWLQLLEDNRA